MPKFETINPATGDPIRRYTAHTPEEVEAVLSLAVQAQQAWARVSMSERAERLRRVAERLRDEVEVHARLMTEEMGKPITDSRSEIEKCAWVCDYYAEHAGAFLAPEVVETDAQRSYVAFPPLGVVFAVMPWNFPYWQVFRFAAPALMAGNGAVLKHAPNVSGCALVIERLFREAGLPEHLFRAVLIDPGHVAARSAEIIRDDRIRAVTLTGSTRAGRAVAAEAGAVLKKTVLELGGSDPYVVLEDADLDAAAETCVASRLLNAGQSCIAAKRFIVVASVYEALLERVVDRMRAVVVGDPTEEATEMGPLARFDLRDTLHRQVLESLTAGADLRLGGALPDRPGAFYPPTVLTDVGPGMPAYEEELFGPVAAVIAVRDEDEAVRIANDTAYGLGAAVFTRDEERGERIAAGRLAAGSCFVNAFVRSDPRLPFGGIKDSGYGRELGTYGIKEFVNVKTVYVG